MHELNKVTVASVYINMYTDLLHDPVHLEDVVALEQALELLQVHVAVQVRVDEADEGLMLCDGVVEQSVCASVRHQPHACVFTRYSSLP